MPSSDRKVVHDTLTTIDGVVSRSEGEDPYRRIIVSPGHRSRPADGWVRSPRRCTPARGARCSQRLGMLGAAPITEVIDHSEAFVAALGDVTGTVVDLGSGGGVPGLVIAWHRPDLDVVLVDRAGDAHRSPAPPRRASRARRAGDRGHGRHGSLPPARRPVDAVVARGFGTPGRLRRRGGSATPERLLVVATPGGDTDRWWTTPRLRLRPAAQRAEDRCLRARVPRGSSPCRADTDHGDRSSLMFHVRLRP